MHMREEQPIAHPVQRSSQSWKALRCGVKHRHHPVLRRQSVIGRQPEPFRSHRLEVSQIRTAATPAALLDVIGKQATQPQRVVPQMRPGHKTARPVAGLHGLAERREGVVGLVVVVSDPRCALADSKRQDDRREIVGQLPFILARRPQRVAYYHIAEQRKRRVRPLSRLEQPLEEPRIIQQRIKTAIRQQSLGRVLRAARAACHQSNRQLSILPAKPGPHICEYHESPPDIPGSSRLPRRSPVEAPSLLLSDERIRASISPNGTTLHPRQLLYLAIPAQNEVATIGVLLWRLRTVLAEFPREYEVVVYDDASADETAAVAEQYVHAMPVTVLRGTKPVGYAGAVDALARYIAGQTRYPRRDAMLLLQGDFTDPPGIVPEFARRFEGGADLVVGERGAVADAPQAVRRLFTAAGWALKPFVRVDGIRDLTGSMRLVRISALRDLLRTVGDAPVCEGDSWTANADLLLRLVPHARRVESVPVEPTYGVRTRETRRITVRDGLAALRWAWRARGRKAMPTTAPESGAADGPSRNARPSTVSRRRDEGEVTADALRERSRERERLRGDNDAATTRREGRPERGRREGPRELARDVSRDSVRDLARDSARDNARDSSQGGKRDGARDASRDASRDARKQESRDARRASAKDSNAAGKAPRDKKGRDRSRERADDSELILDDPFAARTPRAASNESKAPRSSTVAGEESDAAALNADITANGESSGQSPAPSLRTDAARVLPADARASSSDRAAQSDVRKPKLSSNNSDADFDDDADRDDADAVERDADGDGANDSADAAAGENASENAGENAGDSRERKRRRNRRSRRRKSRSRGDASAEAAESADASEGSSERNPERAAESGQPVTGIALDRAPANRDNANADADSDDDADDDDSPSGENEAPEGQGDGDGQRTKSRRRGRRGRRGGSRRGRGRNREGTAGGDTDRDGPGDAGNASADGAEAPRVSGPPSGESPAS